MLNKKSTFLQNVNNKKGQMALFVALIFQILFLFFAMVINVGLLVHHKINLQNSVDLAAYYGAMKQAENMNAIAHVNYQIRQSWKLLAWRYRMIGSAGEWDNHPFNKQTKQIDNSRGGDAEGYSSNADFKKMQDAPAFCITYIPFKPMPPGENTCKQMATYSGVQLFKTPPVIAAHQAFSKVIQNATKVMLNNALQRCRDFGAYNYIMLSKFMVTFNLDQRDRMNFIAGLSRASSLAPDDFYDIDGQKVSTGIKNTLLNNLTSANRSSLGESDVKIFNSLGADGCNSQGAADGQPAKWLNPVRIYPGFSYIDTICRGETGSSGASITPVGRELDGNPANFPHHMNDLDSDVQRDIRTLSQYIGYRGNLNDNYNFSMGVEKNPWCMGYVGVSAEAMPKIPFSPFGGVKLKARAFYKPFGGRIGPWYQERWSPGSERSNAGDKVDPLLPPRVTDLSALGNMNDAENKATRAANFSRFVGDKFGLKTLRMLAHYGKAIYQLDSKWQTDTMDSGIKDDMYQGDDSPNFAHWDDLPFNFGEGSGDVLAWDVKRDTPSMMRRLEIAGIAPDNFDMTYYSIDPDYYHNYYLRIRDGYLKGPGKDLNAPFRPDIGYHKGFKSGQNDLERYTIRDQMKVLKEGDLNLPIEDKFTFTVTDWANLLTSWAPKSLMDYSLDTENFGKCKAEPLGAKDNNPKPPNPGNCVVGGSTGYSVKMVSSQYLRSQELVLGGEAAGAGPLKNPPPSDDDF
ncbi:hypothetical protein AZI86_05895 [Bdellovibrio bacteriovorus]|uniref:Putative Flp pilus-assembly TadG-like N-terminal domain-containing protein n=1 Tax=Bdellovibrio bacteriovorus TaxID=959 RepID=A0A150WQD2_BDEBC|nr:Tad domain-containing protein [Bdellovibrio bacteriovorus]KYG66576.1 hypothetical protein AZI86_05895 [Bdellovibrio bacteriovorus]